MVALSTVVADASEQVSCDLGGEAAILNLKNGAYCALDPVGARVWSFLAVPRRLSEVRDEIPREYDVEAERCESDLLGLVGALADEGLAEIVGEPTG